MNREPLCCKFSQTEIRSSTGRLRNARTSSHSLDSAISTPSSEFFFLNRPLSTHASQATFFCQLLPSYYLAASLTNTATSQHFQPKVANMANAFIYVVWFSLLPFIYFVVPTTIVASILIIIAIITLFVFWSWCTQNMTPDDIDHYLHNGFANLAVLGRWLVRGVGSLYNWVLPVCKEGALWLSGGVMWLFRRAPPNDFSFEWRPVHACLPFTEVAQSHHPTPRNQTVKDHISKDQTPRSGTPRKIYCAGTGKKHACRKSVRPKAGQTFWLCADHEDQREHLMSRF